MEKQSLRLGDPLPRPQYERLELDAETHTQFWRLVLREFDWFGSRIQSRLLYHNRSASQEGSTP
jgi:hypothetical protein